MPSRLFSLLLAVLAGPILVAPVAGQPVRTSMVINRSTSSPAPATHSAPEARLLDVYRLIGHGKLRMALRQAEALARDYPNFQLAQLVYGDLLAAHARPIRELGDVPAALTAGAPPTVTIQELRQESHLRLKALRERPPQGTIPSQFLALSPRNRHAIAIDTSRARLYLFENTGQQLRLMADFYISVGKSGVEKMVEGDARTPLGVYFIISNLDPRTLSDFYGIGALPINYPNILDARRGKTGRGIWLHGTPPNQFSRAPQSSDGCVVLSNPDLDFIIRTVEIRTTPVVIAPRLEWVSPHSVAAERKPFEETLTAWRQAKSRGDLDALLRFYTPDFKSYDKTLAEWIPALREEVDRTRGRPIQLKDLSYLRWTDSADTMVVTFGEVAEGVRTGPIKRQYWIRQGAEWKIFFEGIIG